MMINNQKSPVVEALDNLWGAYENANLTQLIIDPETEEKLFGCFLEVTERDLRRKFGDWKKKQLDDKPKSD